MEKDYYDILGISRNSSAEEIQRAYRTGARRWHPDVNKEAGAEERFKELSEAYSVVSDPAKRKLYDRWGKDWQHAQQYEKSEQADQFKNHFRSGNGGFSDERDRQRGNPFYYHSYGSSDAAGFEDILRDIFSQGLAAEQESADLHDYAQRTVQADLTVSLEELIAGATKTISFAIESVDSQGFVQHHNKTIQVKIPTGVTEGSTIRLKGQGAVGPQGETAGDLMLKIRLRPDPRFSVDNYDLHSEIAIAPWEAALGATIEVETVNGLVRLNIPSGTQSGRQFRLRGKGLSGKADRGDLIVSARIAVPDSLSEAETELFEELSRKSPFNPRSARRQEECEKAA